MSDGHDAAAVAALTGYHGEVAPRRLAIALALNVLMPGLGHVYTGRLRTGVGIYLAVALAFVTFGGLAWGTNMFLPRAALIAAAGWLYLQVTLALRLHRFVARRGASFVLQRSNHPLVYVGLLVALELGPGYVFARLAVDHVLLGFTVADRSAFPELLPGDAVYGTRGAFERTPPARGDLVVVADVVSAPTVLRVVGVPGDDVAIEGGTVIVNGIPRSREPLGAIEVLGRDPAPAEVETIRAWRESADGRSYEVYVPRDVEPQDVPPQRLGAEEFFLLADLRDVERVKDSRQLGAVAAAHIVGRPLWVWWSTAPEDGRVRWSRIGLPVR